MPHSAQSQHTNHWAPRTRKQHQQEHRPQRPTESSDPTQHAKGRPGDCPGPRKGATTRRNVTQGGGGGQVHASQNLAHGSEGSGRCWSPVLDSSATAKGTCDMSRKTRLVTSACQLRHDPMEQGPTEPQSGRSTFLLSSGGAGGRVLLSGFWYGVDRYRAPVALPEDSGMSAEHLFSSIFALHVLSVFFLPHGRAHPCAPRQGGAL